LVFGLTLCIFYGKLFMEIACLDLEGVLAPEIWVAFAQKTGIEEFKLTTRNIPDYDELMRMRINLLKKNNLKLNDINQVIDTLEPLEGAIEFVSWLRQNYQLVILSDTFYQFSAPMMRKLGNPMLLCHKLIVDDEDNIVGYEIRQKNPKRQAILAFKTLYYKTIAVGDSYNDVSMLQEADVGILFHAPEQVIAKCPQFIAVHEYKDLQQEFIKASQKFAQI